jgi:hypothetical protein
MATPPDPRGTERLDVEERGFRIVRPQRLELTLRIEDPEVVEALTEAPDGRARHDLAVQALRIGVLALSQARGRIDADAVRREGDRVVAQLAAQLREHDGSVARHLKEYFDPKSGRLAERLERLVAKDGELESVMRGQVGRGDSELARALAEKIGAESPLMKALSPAEASGVVASLRETVARALEEHRTRITREFSLDDPASALSRFADLLKARHGELGKSVEEAVGRVVGEFSLDDEDSALSRLVRQVEQAQQRITSEFTLDAKSSALARIRSELLGVLEAQRQANDAFQTEVKTALAAMAARKAEAARNPAHGVDFEAEVGRVLERLAGQDVLTCTGRLVGLVKNRVVGDFVLELGPDAAAAGSRIVFEAKEKADYRLDTAREELDLARKNRDAEVGVFVFSRRTAPEGLPPFTRHGNDIFIVWDASDAATDVYLEAAVSVARALCTRAATHREQSEADFEGIDRAVRSVEKLSGGLDEIQTSSTTIQSGAEKILNRVRLMRAELARQVSQLDELVGDLKSSLGG